MINLESLMHNKSDHEVVSLTVSEVKEIIGVVNGLSETAIKNHFLKLDAETRNRRLKDKLGVGENDAFLQD